MDAERDDDVSWDLGGADSSAGISRLEMSSPSSARSAIVLPTGMFLVPSGAYNPLQVSCVAYIVRRADVQ